MKKKQLLALLMAGTLSVGMLPAAAYAEAAAEGAAVVQEVDQEGEAPAAEEPAPVQEAPAEEPVQQEAPVVETVPEQEAPVETPTEAPVETTPEEQPVDPAPTADPAPAEQSADDTAALADAFEEAEVTSDKMEDTEVKPEEDKVYILENKELVEQTSLEEAIANAPATEGGVNENTVPTRIVVTGNIELKAPVVIENKYISISSGGEGATIQRSGFDGDMFTVKEKSALEFAKSSESESDDNVFDLTVNGENGVISNGSIVKVERGGTFGIAQAVTLTGNYSSVTGSAIYNDGGKIALLGGSITGNTVSNGAAIYNAGEIDVQGTVFVSGNKSEAEGQTDANVFIASKGSGILVLGAITGSKILFSVDASLVGEKVIVLNGSDVDMANVLQQIQFVAPANTSYTINVDGTISDSSVKPEEPNPPTDPTPNTTPLELSKAGDPSWNTFDRNRAEVSFQANKAGYYYVTWSDSGIPECDKSKGVTFPAHTPVTAYLENITAEGGISIYVYAWTKDNPDEIEKLVVPLGEAGRPAKEETKPSVTPTVTTRAPYTPKVSESVVKGLEQPLAFYPGKTYSFSVIGAGTDNTDPVKGDVQWRPLYWSSYSKPTSSQRQSIGTIGHKSGISRAATFNMYIFFQKYVYDGNQWQPTDVVESYTYKFQSKAITFTVSPSGTVTPSITSAAGYGGGSGSGYGGYGNDDDDDDYDDPETRDDNGADTGATSTSSNADTADNSPVATMMMLASLSLLTGGYVLVRRRKKA